MKEKIKQAVMELLYKNNDYSFSELVSELANQGLPVKGDRAIYVKKNLIIWDGTTADFNNAIVELEKANKILMKPLSPTEALIAYAYDGVMLDLPMADRIENYSTPHWIPTIIKLK